MKAIVKETFSPLAKKGAVFIKKGKYGILEGHEKRQYVKCGDYNTPNFYTWEQIEFLKDYFLVDIDLLNPK